MPRARPEQAIDRVTADVGRVFGDRLVCLALYGSAADGAFVEGRSDLNFAVVLRQITHGDLKALQGLLPAWHKLGAASPLLIDLDFLEHARDVFPIELEDIRANHRLLSGEDVFAPLRIERAHVRRQLEQESRAKLLRLRVQYAETGGERGAVQALMLDSVTTFLVMIRSVARLLLDSGRTDSGASLDRFEEATGERLTAIREISGVRSGRPWASDHDSMFRDYLADVDRLVEVIDRLPVGSPGDRSGEG